MGSSLNDTYVKPHICAEQDFSTAAGLQKFLMYLPE
jgi:hypothetical protein